MHKEVPKGTVVLFISLAIVIAATYFSLTTNKHRVPQELMAVLRPHAIPLQPFSLLGKQQQLFTTRQMKGKWNFVFFGYTHCPDVCPTTLSTLKQVINKLIKQQASPDQIQVLFVSVDPQRDKPEMLEKYLAYFNKDFIALTGNQQQIDTFSRQFAAAYIKDKPDASGNYLISHTSSVFLVDPQLRIVAAFSPPHDANIISEQYLKIFDMFR